MLDYAQTHIFDAVTTCGRYHNPLLLILTLHSVIHDITSILPVGVNLPLGFNAKWPPHVNRRRAPGVRRLGFNGYDSGQPYLHNVPRDRPTAHVELTRVDSTSGARSSSFSSSQLLFTRCSNLPHVTS